MFMTTVADLFQASPNQEPEAGPILSFSNPPDGQNHRWHAAPFLVVSHRSLPRMHSNAARQAGQKGRQPTAGKRPNPPAEA